LLIVSPSSPTALRGRPTSNHFWSRRMSRPGCWPRALFAPAVAVFSLEAADRGSRSCRADSPAVAELPGRAHQWPTASRTDAAPPQLLSRRCGLADTVQPVVRPCMAARPVRACRGVPSRRGAAASLRRPGAVLRRCLRCLRCPLSGASRLASRGQIRCLRCSGASRCLRCLRCLRVPPVASGHSGAGSDRQLPQCNAVPCAAPAVREPGADNWPIVSGDRRYPDIVPA